MANWDEDPLLMGSVMPAPEAKAKKRVRHEIGIREYQQWLKRQKSTTRAERVEMFDFYIDEAMKRRD